MFFVWFYIQVHIYIYACMYSICSSCFLHMFFTIQAVLGFTSSWQCIPATNIVGYNLMSTDNDINIIQHNSTSLFIGTSLKTRVEESSLILESIHVYSACSSWHPISLAHDMAVTQMITCKKWMLSQRETNHLFVNLNGWNIPCGPSRFKLVYKHHSL